MTFVIRPTASPCPGRDAARSAASLSRDRIKRWRSVWSRLCGATLAAKLRFAWALHRVRDTVKIDLLFNGCYGIMLHLMVRDALLTMRNGV